MQTINPSQEITVAYVKKRVEYIKSIMDDDEAAHGMEDDLHQAVLRAIAYGTCTDPTGCAEAALETLKLDFARWCA